MSFFDSSDSSGEENIICFKCGKPGHISTQCWSKKRSNNYSENCQKKGYHFLLKISGFRM